MKPVILYIALLFLSACQQNLPAICRVVLSLKGTSADSAILRRISMDGHSSKKIDSGLLRFTRDSLIFELPLSPDSLYQVSLKFSQNNLFFISDNSYIRIVMDKKTGRNSINGSPASSGLYRFNETQDSLVQVFRTTMDQSIKSNNPVNKKQRDSVQQILSGLNSDIQERYYNFADSISSSAAFMATYDHIEFGNDYNRMKNLVTKALKRFPNSVAIHRLNEQVLNLIHIQEKELQKGDIFPELRLPGLDNHIYSTDSFRGRYVFIDFWSTWCQKCMIYEKVKMKFLKEGLFKNLVLIHVALDDNLDMCREFANKYQLPGIQLIDKDIWQGQTANKIAFDSIPFNFLLGPDQKILAKAIPADSVINVLKQFIH